MFGNILIVGSENVVLYLRDLMVVVIRAEGKHSLRHSSNIVVFLQCIGQLQSEDLHHFKVLPCNHVGTVLHAVGNQKFAEGERIEFQKIHFPHRE